MTMEHDEIINEKLEGMSERLEQWILDTFNAVLERLRDQNRWAVKSYRHEDRPF